jgi:head-tail adaptor
MVFPQEQATALYRNWFGMIEAWTRMLTVSPRAAPGNLFSVAANEERAGEPGVSGAAAPNAVRPVMEALELTRRLLSQHYASLFPAPGTAGADWHAAAAANAARLKGLADASAAMQKQILESGLRALSGFTPASLATGFPQLEGLDRTYSALTDAFGLGPSKAVRDAWRELLVADQARRKAQLEYFALVAGVSSKVLEEGLVKLRDMAARGEAVDSLLGWVRLWAGVADKAMHEMMQSEAGMKASTDCVRAALRYRQQQHRLVAVVSGLLNVPTRAELDDAYLEIQQLKRQMRELQRSRRPSPAKPHGRKGSTKETGA